MGEQVFYRMSDALPLEEIVQAYGRLEAHFGGFARFSPKGQHNLYLKDKSELPSLGSLRINDLTLRGRLGKQKEPWEDFRSICNRSREVTRLGFLAMTSGFEELQSTQTEDAYDLVTVRLSKDQRSFSYVANGSKVAKDKIYRLAFMERLIHVSGFPFQITKENGGFRLELRGSGKLRVTDSEFGGWNPSSFNYAPSDLSCIELVGIMHKILEACATRKRFGYTWAAGRELGFLKADPVQSKSLYDAVVAASFPADSYEIELKVTIDDIRGLDDLQKLLGPDDELRMRLCGFDESDRNWCEVTVSTTAQEHRLELSLQNMDGLSAIEEQLGRKFEKV